MYSYEIENYLKEKNYNLNNKETIYITDINLHPQIIHIKYNVFENKYQMWTNDNYYFEFKCKLYNKILERVK